MFLVTVLEPKSENVFGVFLLFFSPSLSENPTASFLGPDGMYWHGIAFTICFKENVTPQSIEFGAVG